MLILLSPAKSLDYHSPLLTKKSSKPRLLQHSAELVTELQKLNPKKLGTLMSISDKLAQLNHQRYTDWSPQFTSQNSRPALLAFTGDVYQGLTLPHWSPQDFATAQKQIRILSGLYGVLRPLDLMQPYRLEMGTKLQNNRGKNLCQFWGSEITKLLNQDLKKSGSDTIINLASNEYFSSVEKNNLQGQLITPTFKDEKNGNYKIIAFYAKKARGMMTDFIIRNNITNPADLTQFKTAGYRFSKKESTDHQLVFLRPEKIAS